MESIVERIARGNFWQFHGGIHPPEQKTLTSSKPIKRLPLPKQLIIPLQQHIGAEGNLLVNIGDTVLKGQPLTSPSNPMALAIHAPTSGVISAIKKAVIAHPSGLSELCVFIDVDGNDTWIERTTAQDFTQLSSAKIVEKIADAGIAGMGGAGFPTYVKVNTQKPLDFLIINGAECEPYITADDLLMIEESNVITSGITILDKLLAPKHILVAIEDNKPNAIAAMKQATQAIAHVSVCVVPTKYPTGGEKQLIKVLTGKEIPSGSLPINSGIIMHNIATCYAISEAVINDTPLIERVVTVTGQGLKSPQNVWALLGTPIQFLLEQFEALELEENEKQPVIMGGPMMGFGVSNELVPIIKTSNCILVPSKKEMPSAFDKKSKEVECIRCGECAVVCPSQLLPQELQWSAKAKDYPQLEKLNLSDCIDCGACAYVCPSQIPLVQYYRVAKAEIRQQQQLDLKAEKAKIRFEARKLRLEKEKIAREQKHKKAAEARKAAMNKPTPEAASAKSAVAAALARVKAKKANASANDATVDNSATTTTETAATDTSQKSQVAAAIARAKAKRLKASSNDVSDAKVKTPTAELSSTVQDDDKIADTEPVTTEKSQVAAAIARAKAKRAQKAKINADAASNDIASGNTAVDDTSVDDTSIDNTSVENAAIANVSVNEEVSVQQNESPKTVDADDKKAKIAAAIAKAKAKKLAKTAEQNESLSQNQPSKPETDEAVSKAGETNTTQTTQADTAPEIKNDKKAKIAAAIAKAKAKKLAKAQELAAAQTHENNNPDKKLT